MSKTLLIHKPNENDKDIVSYKNLIVNYLENKKQIESLEQENICLLNCLSQSPYKTFELDIDNYFLKFTITPSKEVNKIDYDKVFEGVEDLDMYKTARVSMVWDEKKVLNSGKEIFYKQETTNPRATITQLKENK